MASRRPTLSAFKKKALKDFKFKREYDALKEEFTLIDQMISARKAAHLTQNEVAKKLRTQQPAIARLESGKLKNITLGTLKRYARVVGCNLKVRLVKSK